jgi:hypothetical protein
MVYLTICDVGDLAILREVDVESVLDELAGRDGAGLENAVLLRKVLLAEVLVASSVSFHEHIWNLGGVAYCLVGGVVGNGLAGELVLPLLGLVLGVTGDAGDDERHVGGCEGV